jgi:hypothetical protein
LFLTLNRISTIQKALSIDHIAIGISYNPADNNEDCPKDNESPQHPDHTGNRKLGIVKIKRPEKADHPAPYFLNSAISAFKEFGLFRSAAHSLLPFLLGRGSF